MLRNLIRIQLIIAGKCVYYIMYKTKHLNEHWKASKSVNLEVT